MNNRVYTALPKQSKFHHTIRKRNLVWFNGGRGSGKTTAGAIQSILEVTTYQSGEDGLIVAPTYDNIHAVIIPELMRWLPPHYITRKLDNPRILRTFANGSTMYFGSADRPDSLRGPNRAWLWFDEPRVSRTREAFDIAVGQIRRGAERIWLTSTPAGMFHWLYDLFVANPLPDSKYITSRMEDNIHTSVEYKARLRAQYAGLFAQQELDAAFVSFEGIIIDNFSLTENVTEAVDYDPALGEVYWGVDDGYAHGEGVGTPGHHPRVFLLAQLRPDGGLNFFAEYYQTLALPEASINEVFTWPYPRPVLAMVDSSAVELRARLHDAGIMTGPGTHTVTEGVKVLRRFICDGNGVRLLKIHPRCVNLIRELQLWRYDDRSGLIYAGERKPLKLNDHTPDASRYLLWNFR